MLLRDFSPVPLKNKEAIKRSSSEILEMVRGVIPSSPINEHDIFETMKEMNFQYSLDNENNYIYLWNLYEK